MSLSLNLKTYLLEGHPFRTQGNFSEKQYFLPPMRTRYANVIANTIAFGKFCIRAKYRSSKTEICNCKWPIPSIKRIRFYVFCDKLVQVMTAFPTQLANGFSQTLLKNEDILSAENLSSKLTIKRLKRCLIDIILVCYSGLLFWLILNKLNIIFCTFTKYFYCWFWICICAIKVRK